MNGFPCFFINLQVDVMKIFSVFIILGVFISSSGCSSKYASLSGRISLAVSPQDLLSLTYNVQTAGLKDTEKRKLNIKLAKKTLSLSEAYVRLMLGGKKFPEKGEVLDMIKLLSENIENGLDSEFSDRLKEMIGKFSEVLLKRSLNGL